MEVFEINFNDPDISQQIPVNIFSTIGINENGELIKMINIESLNSKEMTIEIFGNGNFYNKGIIEERINSPNILSFQCSDEVTYFIKIVTYEIREIELDNEHDNEFKISLLFFGNYKFYTNILNFIDKKKLK